MERHFQHELEGVKTNLIKMGSAVEENINNAVIAILERNEVIAAKVIESDKRIDTLEIEIDNAIIDMLALQQPVASDLRFIIAAQKINNDLERIGDHAVNLAESALTLQKSKKLESLLEIPQMVSATKLMLKYALDSFILLDPKMARIVLETDDQIDEWNRSMTTNVIELLKNDKQLIEPGLALIRISQNLERVADMATNIAEEVIFHIQALVVKHHAEEI
ncbi:MAG: phosphate signaling complex protein PhoU [Ignavibacteriae bacterium]|nr:MAG: phosphate signaling complex protein PhoU [Ignavibacteriota bacterium]